MVVWNRLEYIFQIMLVQPGPSANFCVTINAKSARGTRVAHALIVEYNEH